MNQYNFLHWAVLLLSRHYCGRANGTNTVLFVIFLNFTVCSYWIIDKNYTPFAPMQFLLQWRRNGCNGVSKHQAHDCLLNRLFRRRSEKTSTLRVTGLCVGTSPVTGEFPHKGPVTRKMVPFDDVIMLCTQLNEISNQINLGYTSPGRMPIAKFRGSENCKIPSL